MDKINVLVSLTRGYGLGDAVQMSAVLRHVKKYRPNWIVDFQAEPGRETVGFGIAHNIFVYGEKYPSPYYDAEVQIVLYDTFANWHDRPNTRVTSCLHEKFGIDWDKDYCEYQINIPDSVLKYAKSMLTQVHRPVAIHYRGDSAPENKDLQLEQAESVCKYIISLGCTPLVLDWRKDPLTDRLPVASLRKLGFDPGMGREARINCAIISACEAFVGIDSGPSKCASATKTPSLVVWTRHHPAPFHDPASNTTHLVPIGYHGLKPVFSDPGVIEFFEANYSVQQYDDCLVDGVCAWLQRVL